MVLSIIGTAGRGRQPELTLSFWNKLYYHFTQQVQLLKPTALQSGGAAWADHLAVRYGLQHNIPVVIHLPALLLPNNGFIDTKAGRTANYYHHLFSKIIKQDSLKQLYEVIVGDKNSFTISDGFFARNALVANCDVMIAYTFGPFSSAGIQHSTKAGLQDGGTAHTWNLSKSLEKYHFSLCEL